MNVLEALRLVSTMPNNAVLLAAYPLTWGSEAGIVAHDAQFNIPRTDVDAGFKYVLEKEDLVRLLGYASEKRMSEESTAEFVIHYALHDGYPSWFNDIPDA
jgi:hypothetical protein